jgi:hypothetical protein
MTRQIGAITYRVTTTNFTWLSVNIIPQIGQPSLYWELPESYNLTVGWGVAVCICNQQLADRIVVNPERDLP